jgi:hypothetical protein
MLLKIKLKLWIKSEVLRRLSLVLFDNLFLFVLSSLLHLIWMPCVRMMSMLVVVCAESRFKKNHQVDINAKYNFKLSLCLIKHQAMKTCEGEEIQLDS